MSTLLQQKLGRMSSGSGPKQGDDTAITERTHTYRFRIATSTPIVRELTGPRSPIIRACGSRATHSGMRVMEAIHRVMGLPHRVALSPTGARGTNRVHGVSIGI